MQTASRKVVNGWAFYDWANSVYNLVITTTFFPAYYAAVTGTHNEAFKNGIPFLGRTFVNTELKDYVLSFGFLIIALLSPIAYLPLPIIKAIRKISCGFSVTWVPPVVR
jgi:UMF1 family MFS transporter